MIDRDKVLDTWLASMFAAQMDVVGSKQGIMRWAEGLSFGLMFGYIDPHLAHELCKHMLAVTDALAGEDPTKRNFEEGLDMVREVISGLKEDLDRVPTTDPA